MQIDYPTRINILSAAIEKVHIRCIELARYFFESINPLIIISLVNYIMFEHLSSDTDAISAFLSIPFCKIIHYIHKKVTGAFQIPVTIFRFLNMICSSPFTGELYFFIIYINFCGHLDTP